MTNPRGVPLFRAAQELPRDTRAQIFDWMDKRGPFIDDDRQVIDEDLFFFEEHEVTELGLGEAARRILAEFRTATLSPIRDDHSRFAANPLMVVHGFHDEPIRHVPIPNYTEPGSLIEVLHALDPEPDNWQDLLESCRRRFDHLVIGTHCDEHLGRFMSPAAVASIIL